VPQGRKDVIFVYMRVKLSNIFDFYNAPGQKMPPALRLAAFVWWG